MTDNGQNMTTLLRTREEVVYWLKQSSRFDEAAEINGDERFLLSGTNDGLVYIHTGPGLSNKEPLIDLKGDDA